MYLTGRAISIARLARNSPHNYNDAIVANNFDADSLLCHSDTC